MSNFRKIILIDLDGVLNTYIGDFDKTFIPPIKEGAKDFVEKLSKEYDLKLFTTREKELALQWLINTGLSKFILGVTNFKEPCYLFIDDRCINFDGDFYRLHKKITDFKPWYK